MEQPSHGDQFSQILAKLTEQSERMSRQEQFVTQQSEAIAIQTETLERLQKENQELHQKIKKNARMIFLTILKVEVRKILSITILVMMQDLKKKNPQKHQLIQVTHMPLKRSSLRRKCKL